MCHPFVDAQGRIADLYSSRKSKICRGFAWITFQLESCRRAVVILRLVCWSPRRQCGALQCYGGGNRLFPLVAQTRTFAFALALESVTSIQSHWTMLYTSLCRIWQCCGLVKFGCLRILINLRHLSWRLKLLCSFLKLKLVSSTETQRVSQIRTCVLIFAQICHIGT